MKIKGIIKKIVRVHRLVKQHELEIRSHRNNFYSPDFFEKNFSKDTDVREVFQAYQKSALRVGTITKKSQWVKNYFCARSTVGECKSITTPFENLKTSQLLEKIKQNSFEGVSAGQQQLLQELACRIANANKIPAVPVFYEQDKKYLKNARGVSVFFMSHKYFNKKSTATQNAFVSLASNIPEIYIKNTTTNEAEVIPQQIEQYHIILTLLHEMRHIQQLYKKQKMIVDGTKLDDYDEAVVYFGEVSRLDDMFELGLFDLVKGNVEPLANTKREDLAIFMPFEMDARKTASEMFDLFCQEMPKQFGGEDCECFKLALAFKDFDLINLENSNYKKECNSILFWKEINRVLASSEFRKRIAKDPKFAHRKKLILPIVDHLCQMQKRIDFSKLYDQTQQYYDKKRAELERTQKEELPYLHKAKSDKSSDLYKGVEKKIFRFCFSLKKYEGYAKGQ